MRSGKSRLISILFSFILCIGALSFGVYAAVTSTLGSGGSVSFNAYEVDVDIEGKITGATTDGELTYSGTTNTSRKPAYVPLTSKWNLGNLVFDESIAMCLNDIIIKIQIKLINYSVFPVVASISIPSMTGINVSTQNIEYCYSYDKELGADERYIVVTLNPLSYETPVNLANLNLILNINKTVNMETELSNFTFETVDGINTILGATQMDKIIMPRFDSSGSSDFIIGTNAFKNFTTLTDIVIPNNISVINSSAFHSCVNLIKVSLPKSLISIGNNAFENCINLRNIVFAESLTNLGGATFFNCSTFTHIDLPVSLNVIGSNAFDNCSKLTTVFIPANVKSIGYAVFNGNRLLTRILVDEKNTKFCSMDGILYTKDMKTIWQVPAGKKIGDFVLPSTVNAFAQSAFDMCFNLTGIVIPNTITSIPMNVFRSCTGLKTIVIPDSVNTIVADAFINCYNLESVYFERQTVFTTIGTRSFNSMKMGSFLYFKNQIVFDQFVAGTHYTSANTSKRLY